MKDSQTATKRFVKYLSQIAFEDAERSTNLYKGKSRLSQIRRENLSLYLNFMQTLNPETLLLGEAPGYKGCRLTGIPFSSEKVLRETAFFQQFDLRVFSDAGEEQSEQSAKIVWEELSRLTKNPPLIWNIYPFHPHEAGNIYTNRTPNAKDLALGKEILLEYLKLFPSVKTIAAVGRKAEKEIQDIGLEVCYVRHPARGGKKAFIEGLRQLLV